MSLQSTIIQDQARFQDNVNPKSVSGRLGLFVQVLSCRGALEDRGTGISSPAQHS